VKDSILILVVEDDPDLREALCDTLNLSSMQTIEAEDAEDALDILSKERVNLIISDVQMPGMDGHALLKVAKRQFPEIPFVLITAYSDVAKAVEAIQMGAADYIAKPFEAAVLIEMVNRLALPAIDVDDIVIVDRRSQDLAELAKRVAATEVTVMISGESGCGKEVYAKYIHEHSPRSNKPFFAINCAAIPESMLESILFGYEKGAFTGAYTSRAGKFEQANGGTLLLDEISEMDISLQAKLLRVIQEKEVERLGSGKTIDLDVRIIATTNRDLKDEVSKGRFREDLFYRLNVFPLYLPPLRERPDDIIPLAEKLLEHLHPGMGIQIAMKAKALLVAHRWQGNVRELENVMQRALILKSGLSITCEDIIFENISRSVGADLDIPASQPELSDSENLLDTDLKTREKEIIIKAVTSHRSRKEAAEKLGISPRTLRYKIAQFRRDGITIPCFIDAASAS
jgi:two-component system response regulator FlrC